MNAALWAFGSAFLISALLTPFFRHLGKRLGWMDRPTERSSHAVPTPRTGGKAIVLAITATAFASGSFADLTLAAIIGLVVFMSVLGLVDDARNLSAGTKLAIQTVLAVALLVLPGMRMPLLLAVGALIWLVGVTNGFNFMDGVNGIASMEAIICGVAMGLMLLRAGDAAAAALCFIVAGAAAGFFPWNAFTGSVFMGDVGSLPLGFFFAALTLRGALHGIPPWLMAAPLLPFLLDTGLTLLRRTARRDRIFQAHRTHFYQQLTDLGWPHLAVTLLWGSLAAVAAAVALATPRLGGWATTSFVAVVILNLVILLLVGFVRRRL